MSIRDIQIAAGELFVVAGVQLKENEVASSVEKRRAMIIDGQRVLVSVEIGEVEDDRWESN